MVYEIFWLGPTLMSRFQHFAVNHAKKKKRRSAQFIQIALRAILIHEVKIAFVIARRKLCSSFVWNSQGAVFYAHRSERL